MCANLMGKMNTTVLIRGMSMITLQICNTVLETYNVGYSRTSLVYMCTMDSNQVAGKVATIYQH